MKTFVLASTLLSATALTSVVAHAADSCTNKRRKEHCQWLLSTSGNANWWYEINNSATLDANSTTSEYYFQRAAEHCEWFLKEIVHQPDLWTQIDYAALKDCHE